MMIALANYIISSLIVTAVAISVGISQGLTNQTSLHAINLQPSAKDDLNKLALLSSALIETAAILGAFFSMVLLMDASCVMSVLYSNLSKIGIGFAIICSGLVIGIASAWPAQQACLATARQPFHASGIFNFTLLLLSIIQTPLILAFIVAWFIKSQATRAADLSDSLRLISAGFAIGVGCIGPVIGLALFGSTACKGIGINRNAYNRIVTFSFLSQAIIESPVIFAMLTSLVLLFLHKPINHELAGYAFLASGLATGLGTFGPGLSSGRTAAAACRQIALNPNAYASLSRTSIFAQGVIDTAAIYVLLVSLLIVFFV